MRTYLFVARVTNEAKPDDAWVQKISDAIVAPNSYGSPLHINRIYKSLQIGSPTSTFDVIERPPLTIEQVEFEVTCPTLSKDTLETWIMLFKKATDSDALEWWLELDEIGNGEVIMKSGRDYRRVEIALSKLFERVLVNVKAINAAAGVRLLND